MRLAVLILGLILGFLMTAQSILVYVGTSIGGEYGTVEFIDDKPWIGASIFVVLAWIVGVAFIIPNPSLAQGSFAVAAGLAFVIARATFFGDMYLWCAISAVLAVLSHFGVREKDKKDAEQAQLKAYMLGQQFASSHPASVNLTSRPQWMNNSVSRTSSSE